MTENPDLRRERDEDLAHGFTDRARGLLNAYEGWLGDDIRDLQGKIETLQFTSTDNPLLELQLLSTELEVIERYRLPEAKRNLRKMCSEIDEGTFDTIIDANQYLQDGVNRLESIARSILSIRKIVDEAWDN